MSRPMTSGRSHPRVHPLAQVVGPLVQVLVEPWGFLLELVWFHCYLVRHYLGTGALLTVVA